MNNPKLVANGLRNRMARRLVNGASQEQMVTLWQWLVETERSC